MADEKTMQKQGPYTMRRNELTSQYRWKAENIVRFFDKLGMTKKQKIKFLSQELAGAYMQAELTAHGIRMLNRGGESWPMNSGFQSKINCRRS